MTGKTLIKSISISGFFFFCSELGFSDLTFFFLFVWFCFLENKVWGIDCLPCISRNQILVGYISKKYLTFVVAILVCDYWCLEVRMKWIMINDNNLREEYSFTLVMITLCVYVCLCQFGSWIRDIKFKKSLAFAIDQWSMWSHQ